ncbi:glyoxalase [Gemmatimonadetes bacterium T265]|nr:glyoxalase [Gemmatimonadetes bacterium T265]
MRLEHLAVWTRDADSLERLRAFYVTHFGAVAGPRYASARRPGFLSYFLRFPAPGPDDAPGARLELMTAPDLAAVDLAAPARGESIGYAHLALAVGDRAAVDALVARLRAAGVPVLSGPRETGDGYYEAAVRDPDGNLVEVMADPRAAPGVR